MPRILLLGMSALDAIYRVPAIPASPTKVLATGFLEAGGGMAANASVGVARLGAQTHYWGRLGDDALGDRILADLVREAVDVSSVRRLPGRVSPSAAILIDAAGERLVCAYNDPQLDNDPGWLPLGRIREFAAVLTDVRWPQGAAAVLDAARAAGRPAASTATWVRSKRWRPDAKGELRRVFRTRSGLPGGRGIDRARAPACGGRDHRNGRRHAGPRRIPLAGERAASAGFRRSPCPRGRHPGGRRRLARCVHAAVGRGPAGRRGSPVRQRGGRRSNAPASAAAPVRRRASRSRPCWRRAAELALDLLLACAEAAGGNAAGTFGSGRR